MAILDQNLRVSTAQALTSGTIISTDSVDLSVARDIGTGQEVYLQLTVGTAFAGGTSVQPQIITSANSNLSSPTVLGSGPALTLAQLTAGAQFAIPVPPVNPAGRGSRYFGVQYVIVGTFTGGTITADFVFDAHLSANRQYASGFTIN